ncbi:hypothetical protein [Desulfosporosinus lacus]|uniref:Uncharacterized protein n=1 Tax=Desulfosporosinus lacus DSM 15449 TaxID=1121420 RepID=A0A1M5QD88_9FIRM|nr:hypothetical protein [Desulfosporosinus lacus]SHH12144.1 hypothetical protein SAMN02746098_00224 [Desulfosporosinus lacus DSM 15449]
MSGNQPGGLCGESLNMGISIFAPISSVHGSSSLLFAQPLLTGSVFASAAVLIGSEFFLFIANHLFHLKSIPVLDARNGQTVQMSLTELQEFLRWMANGIGVSQNSNRVTDGGDGNVLSNEAGRIDHSTGFLTVTSPEAPLTVAIYISANYSNEPFTPSISFYLPILVFPGIRGALPLLILGLLATIFVRAVVPPESTGAKPLPKPEPEPEPEPRTRMNNPLTYSANDLLQLLTKFRKNLGTK